MGLSGRRRAKKETRTTTLAPSIDGESSCADSHQLHQRIHKRTGNTYRRVHSSIAKELKHANLLEFQVNRGWRDDLLPARQATHPDIGASPNANLYNRKMLRILDDDYTTSVSYSLNKKRRWQFAKQLRRQYDSREEVRAQNIFIAESEARAPKRGSTRKVSTNAGYTVEAAAELRRHKRQLARKCASQPKEQVMSNDRFEFSERVTGEQAERPLTSLSAASGGSGYINAASIRRSCNLWNHLYNVSPKAEEARMALQRDYEGRLEIFVGTCETGKGVDTNRCQQNWEKMTRCQKMNSRDSIYNMSRSHLIRSRARKMRRANMELQLEKDGAPCAELEEEAATLLELEAEAPALAFTREVTLFDAMRPLAQGSANKAKKLAMKAQKAAKMEKQQLRKKQRNDSEETRGSASSGYNSGRDEADDEATAAELEANATESADARMLQAVEAALLMERPTVHVAKEAAEPARLAQLFSRQQLVVGSSLPMKLAILLRADLSETVVFEETDGRDGAAADGDNNAFVSFAVHHGCCNSVEGARTSAQEVASQPDPFAFLQALASTEAAWGVEPNRPSAVGNGGGGSSHWRQADVLSEDEARLAAIRALPMFSSSSTSETELSDADAELVPSFECEICCQQLGCAVATGGAQFAEGSTMLIGCGHCFCNGCWLQHVASSVARGRADVACPGHKCQTALDAATLLWFCPSDLLAALTAAAFRAWLSDRRPRRQRRYCPQPQCGRLLECRRGVNAVCGACSQGLCLSCGMEPHWPSDCATAAEYRKRMEFLGHTTLFQRDLEAETEVNAKQCPTCQLVMEKGFGCNHMSCPCGEHFCWWCGQPMRTHRGGACFRATGDRTRSSYRVRRVFTAKDSYLVPNSSQSRLYCAAVKARLYRQSAPLRLRTCRLRLADLFASYALRFPLAPDDDSKMDGVVAVADGWRDAKTRGRRWSDRLVDAAIQASYLVEYAYAHMDRRPDDRRTSGAVRVIGSHVEQLVGSVTTEIREQCRLGYRGPKRTKAACERLLLLRRCLLRQCRLLHGIVAAHRDRRLAAAAPAAAAAAGVSN